MCAVEGSNGHLKSDSSILRPHINSIVGAEFGHRCFSLVPVPTHPSLQKSQNCSGSTARVFLDEAQAGRAVLQKSNKNTYQIDGAI